MIFTNFPQCLFSSPASQCGRVNPNERQEIEIKPPLIDGNKCKYFALSTSFANHLLLIARIMRFPFFLVYFFAPG